MFLDRLQLVPSLVLETIARAVLQEHSGMELEKKNVTTFQSELTLIQSQGGTVQGSINIPAQSLYPTIASVHTLFKAAGVKKAIFYCGSSPRLLNCFTPCPIPTPISPNNPQAPPAAVAPGQLLGSPTTFPVWATPPWRV